MSEELVERLREFGVLPMGNPTPELMAWLRDNAELRREAAATIERLTRENADLRVNLAEFLANAPSGKDSSIVRRWTELVAKERARAEAAESALAKAQQERDEARRQRDECSAVLKLERDLGDQMETSAEALSAQLAKAREALAGLIGLVQLVRNRDDCPSDIRQSLTYHYRLDDAYAALAPAKTATPTLDASAGHTAGDPTGHASLARLSVTIVGRTGGGGG